MGVINKGSDLMLFINTGSGVKSIAFAKSHSLSITGETVETSTKDSSGKWKAQQVVKRSWSVSTENLYSLDGEGASYADLFNLMSEGKEIDIVFAMESDWENKADFVPSGGWSPSSTGRYSGKVVITSLELNAQDGDNATFSASFEGVGALEAK